MALNWFKPTTSPALPAPIQKSYNEDFRRKLAEQMIAEGSSTAPVRTHLAGLSRMLQAGLGAYTRGKVEKQYGERGEAYQQTLAAALSGASAEADPQKKLAFLAEALAQNPDTADIGTDLSVKSIMSDIERAGKQGRMVTAEEMSILTGGAISAPGFIGADGKPEILEPPKLPSYSPGSTIMGYGGQQETLDASPPTGYRNWQSGMDPNYAAHQERVAAAPGMRTAGGQIIAAGLDAGGESGQQMIDYGMGLMKPDFTTATPSQAPMQAVSPMPPNTLGEDQVNAAFNQYASPLGPTTGNTNQGNPRPLDRAGLPTLPTKAEREAEVARAKADAEAAAKRTAERPAKIEGARQAYVKSEIVKTNVKKAIEQAKTFSSTGIIGQSTRDIGQTPAFDLQGTIKTIQANLGFQELQAMREASPTGGALGQVAVKELEFLQAALANLDTAQSQQQLIDNLNAVNKHYSEWQNVMRQAYPELNIPEQGGGVPQGIDPSVWEHMTPQERSLWQ